MMKISENIVNKNHTIASASKKMVEHLLSMEENEKKFFVLKKTYYLENFLSAQNEFEKNLKDILDIEAMSAKNSQTWNQLYDQYRSKALLPNDLSRIEQSNDLWISESDINSWLETISSARLENEIEMEQANTELNRRGILTVQTGLGGLGISIFVGVFGGMIMATLIATIFVPLFFSWFVSKQPPKTQQNTMKQPALSFKPVKKIQD